MFNVKTIEKTIELICEKYQEIKIGTELINIEDSVGRVVSNDILSNINIPHFTRSTVDGYCLKYEDIDGASEFSPIPIKLKGKIKMGEPHQNKIKDDECYYVPTGGMIAEGCNAVVMIEDTETLDDMVLINKSSHLNENLLLVGADTLENDVVIKKGTTVRAQEVGLLAGIGIKEIEVYKKIKCSIISTGDEIIGLNEELTLGKIRDINSFTISARLRQLGLDIINKEVVTDYKDKLKDAVSNSLKESDIVILSGGSSVGDADYTYEILETLEKGSVFVHGVSIKPGKPTIFGRVNNKVVIGLPGQPASAFLILNVFINKIINTIYKRSDIEAPYINAKLESNVASAKGRRTYKMVTITPDNKASIVYGKSGMITLMTKADGYIVIDELSEGLLKDETVKVYLFE